jgi:hypothetical protein
VTFDELLTQILDLLQREGRVSYWALRQQFKLSDEDIEDLKDEIIVAKRLASDEQGKVLVWTGSSTKSQAPIRNQEQEPLAYTPSHLAEKILHSKAALEGE